MMMGIGVLLIVAGYGVQQRRQWGRVLTLVLAGILGLFALFGLLALDPSSILTAAYAVTAYVILLKGENAAEFQ